MKDRTKIALLTAASLLGFGLLVGYTWLPTEWASRRAGLLLWLLLGAVAVAGFVWWQYGLLEARRLRPALTALRAATPGYAEAAADASTEMAQRAQVLAQQAARSAAALADATNARRAAEQALHESQERYALAVRAAEDGLWEWHTATDVLYLSPRWESMLGFAEGELPPVFATWLERIHPSDRPTVQRALEAHVAGASTRFESEHRVVHKDGSARWVFARGTALRNASGKTYRMICLDSDITQYKRIEATLQHVAAGTANVTGAEFYRALVEHFAQALDVAEVFVTECIDQPPTRVRTLACWERGTFIQEEYDLAPTPCKVVFDTKQRYFVPRDLAMHFPNELPYGFVSYLGVPILSSHGFVLGHLVIKDDKPMDEGVLMEAVYRIFTARAGVEMQRSAREKSLLRAAHGLSAISDARQRLAALVSDFSKYCGAREAFITQCLDDPPTRVRALCYWHDGATSFDVEYDLAGNPCEQVYGDGKALYWPKLLGERWPLEREFNRESYLGLPLKDAASGRVLGHLACCDSQSMAEEAPDADALALFTERGRAELLAHLKAHP